MQSAWACILMALVGFMLALNKERFPKMGAAFSFALLTYPIVAIPGAVPWDSLILRGLKGLILLLYFSFLCTAYLQAALQSAPDVIGTAVCNI